MKAIAPLLALYFFLLSIAPNLQGVQLLNLSNFIEHYEQHTERNPESTLLSFIKEHYFSNVTEFEKEHQHLPLKTNLTVSNVSLVCDFPQFTWIKFSDVPSFELQQKLNIRYLFGYVHERNQAIWHPPQLS